MKFPLARLARRLRVGPTLLVSPLPLAFAQSPVAGTLSGSVSNADTGGFFEGAEVSVGDQPARTLTDRNGSFALPGLGAETYTLKVHYTGCGVVTQSIEIRPGTTTIANVVPKSDAYAMEAFTVTSAREGEAASITKQRNADNIVNVFAIEMFGDVADGNRGNFMVRLPGVSAEETSNRDITLKHFKPTATLSYLTRAGAARNPGIALSLSDSVTEMPRDRMNLSRVDPDGRVGLARTLAEVNTRQRAGAGLKFDYRWNESTSVALKFNYSMYRYEGMREIAAAGSRRGADYSRVSRAQIEAGTAPRDSANATAGVAPGFTDADKELLGATWTNAMGYVDRLGRNDLGEISGQKQLPGDQKLTFQASYNPSWFDADLPTLTATLTNGINTTAAGIGRAIDSRQNRSRPFFVPTYGPSLMAGGAPVSLYTGVFTYGKIRTEEEMTNVQADYGKDWKTERFPIQFKAGASLRSQHRQNTSISSGTDRVVGVDGAAGRNPGSGVNDDLAFLRVSPGYGLFNAEYPRHDFFDLMVIREAVLANPSYFQSTASNNVPSTNEATEDVYAGAAQGRVLVGRFRSISIS